MKYIANPVQVEAHRITEVGEYGTIGSIGGLSYAGRRLKLEGAPDFIATDGMLARMMPAVGDYVVVQEDGYTYLNPQDVFRRKYHPLSGACSDPAAKPTEPKPMLSAKILCFELARLIANRFGIDEESFTVQQYLADGDTFVMYAPGEMGGLQVSVKTMPTEFGMVAAGKTAAVEQGGADRSMSLDQFSVVFLQPAAAVLCNCLSIGDPK